MPEFPTDKAPRRDNYEVQRLQERALERMAHPEPTAGPSLWSKVRNLVRRTRFLG